jgi:hypothetical protein
MVLFGVGESGVHPPEEAGVTRPLRKIPPRKGAIVISDQGGAMRNVESGGELLYTTCSYLRRWSMW